MKRFNLFHIALAISGPKIGGRGCFAVHVQYRRLALRGTVCGTSLNGPSEMRTTSLLCTTDTAWLQNDRSCINSENGPTHDGSHIYTHDRHYRAVFSVLAQRGYSSYAKRRPIACSGLHAMVAGAGAPRRGSLGTKLAWFGSMFAQRVTPTAEKDNLSTRTRNLCPLFGASTYFDISIANCNHSLKVTSASAIDAMVVPSGSSKSTCSSHPRSEETPWPSTFKGFAPVMSNKAEATKIRFRSDRTLAHVSNFVIGWKWPQLLPYDFFNGKLQTYLQVVLWQDLRKRHTGNSQKLLICHGTVSKLPCGASMPEI